ncbi:hypothetical protein XENOCAPTIV_018127, partial [Xenoophorus captivus]
DATKLSSLLLGRRDECLWLRRWVGTVVTWPPPLLSLWVLMLLTYSKSHLTSMTS